MANEKKEAGKSGELLPERTVAWTLKVWRPVATALAVGFALMIAWGVVNGEHGLRVWLAKRAEDRQLQKQIEDLEQENARLRDHVERLKSDPDAIEQAARDRLHYAKPGEVIIALPPDRPAQQQQTGAGK